MKFFVQNKCTNQCDKCNYCKKIAEKVICKNDEVYDYLKELYQSFDDVKM